MWVGMLYKFFDRYRCGFKRAVSIEFNGIYPVAKSCVSELNIVRRWSD